jgi:hypothetical protein
VNVVLAAVPSSAAGGASGVFSTAQQFGGAVGVVVVGAVLFAKLEDGRSFTDAFVTALPITGGLFLAAAALALLLPRTAVADAEEI